jgi:hypothetical protein
MPSRNKKGLTPNQQLNELQYSPAVFKYDVAADTTTAAVAFVAPFAMQIVDISVTAQATSGSGTITPRKGATDAMCTAITCATDGAVSRLAAGAVVANAARLILAKGDSVYVIANGSTDRGVVTFWAVRL